MSYGHVAAIALLAYLFLDRPVRFVLLRWLQNSTTFGAKVHEVLRFMVLCAWGATALLACAAVLKIEPKPASAFDAATRLDVLAAVAALAFLGLSQLATILANRKYGETIVRPLVASAHFTRFFAVFLGVTALASLGVQHATTLGYDGGWLAPFGHMLEATTPAQLSLAALATVLAIRVLGEPALRRMVIAAKPRPSLWLVGTFGAVDALASVAFLLTISAGVTALALLLLRLFIELDGATISTVMADRVVGSVRELQRGFSHLHGRLVLGFAAMLAAGLASEASRASRASRILRTSSLSVARCGSV
jgi:hypothetical protein